MSSSSSDYKPLATLRGGRTKKVFKFFWNTENHYVYLEKPVTFFTSPKEKTSIMASSWEMAYHAAEAYVHDR